MKKICFRVSLVLIISLLAFSLFGCKTSSDKTNKTLLNIDGANINGNEIFMFVDHNTTSVLLAEKVVCNQNYIWKLYYDELGQIEIPTKIASGIKGGLSNGNNLFYIVVSSLDEQQTIVYKLTIHRSYQITIMYYDDTNLIKTDYSYTGEEYIVDCAQNIKGCTISYWKDKNGEEVKTLIPFENVILYAQKIVNKYTITLDSNSEDELVEDSIDITYGEMFKLPVPTPKTGYSFIGWYLDRTKITDENGQSFGAYTYDSDIVLTAKYRNTYYVQLDNSGGYGYVSGGGFYEYNSECTITATPYIGCNFIGWYQGSELITNEQSYKFKLETSDVLYTAIFEEKTEMSDFYFNSTSTTCEITGIKNSNVTRISIPAYVTKIEKGALRECKKIQYISLPFIGESISSNTYLGYIFGANDANNNTEYVPNSLKEVTMLEGLTRIGNYAFFRCTNLISITIPEGVTSIGNYAFSGCSSITSIKIPNSVVNIGNAAFSYCSSLTSISIPNSVKGIGIHAFENCNSLTSIVIPDGVTSIGHGAFSGCSRLTIYCEVSSKPSGWNSNWNLDDRPVIWGY